MFEKNLVQFEQLKNHFEKSGQDHVFRFWDNLSDALKEKFYQQLKTIDLQQVNRFIEEFLNNTQPQKAQKRELFPADVIRIPETEEQIKKREEAKKVGEKTLSTGKVGIVLVAGGQETRLGFSGPKGKFPVTPVRKKSLYQI